MTRRSSVSAGGSPGDAQQVDYIALVRGYLSTIHKRLNDPLYRLRFGVEKRRQAAALAAWDRAIDDCTREMVKTAPPEYTIAGGCWVMG
jgi:hypothetical protein